MAQYWTARTEQGFRCRQHGTPSFYLEDFEELVLSSRYVKAKDDSTPPA